MNDTLKSVPGLGAMEKRLSIIFGLLIGLMWMGEVVMGNLGGTPVFGNDFRPAAHALAPQFALAAVCVAAFGSFVAAYRTFSIAAALRVGVWSGLISGAITLLTVMTVIMSCAVRTMYPLLQSYPGLFTRMASRAV